MWFGFASAHAQSRTFTDFDYDPAGNLIRIESTVSENAPVVNDVQPDTIRIGPATEVVLTGTDLRGAEVASDDPSLTIGIVQSTNTELRFELQAADDTVLGLHQLTISTSLGDTSAGITVHPRLPRLLVAPAPVAVGLGESVPLALRLSNADVFAQDIGLAVLDTGIATVTPSAISIPAGALTATAEVLVSGVALGGTQLALTSAALGDDTVPVFVTAPFTPEPGAANVQSSPLGVIVEFTPPPAELATRGPFAARLGVVLEEADPPAGDLDIDVRAPALGVTLDRVLFDIQPSAVIAGEPDRTFTLAGIGLDAVTEASVSPPDDVTVSGFAAAADGRSATVQIRTDDEVALGMRTLVLNTADDPIRAAPPDADRLFVSLGAPNVVAVEPVLVTRLTPAATLVVRGTRFHDALAINVDPPDGIALGAGLTVNSEGTAASIPFTVAEFAPLGPRVVTITTVAGSSDATPRTSNTMTVVNGPVTDHPALISARVGVVLESTPIPEQLLFDALAAPATGVIRGAAVTGLSPATGIIGTSLTLTIEGAGLELVDGVQLAPDDGLTLGPPVPAADGLSVDVPMDIGADAPQALRHVQVFAGTNRIDPATPDADRFRVTAPQPVLDSVSPTFLVAGGPPVAVTLRGENLEGAVVSVVPPTELSLGPPSIAPDNASLSFSAAAGAAAALGDRAVVVTTPAGATSALLSPTNTLRITDTVIGDFAALASAKLGVVLEETPVVEPPEPVLTVSPALGVVLEETLPEESFAQPLFSSALGVTFGAAAIEIDPPVVTKGTAVELTITGTALDTVTAVSFSPSTDISVDGALVATPDGRELSVPVIVAADADESLRQVTLAALGGPIPFLAGRDRIRVVGEQPIIESIQPIQELPGAAFALTVRGFNLDGGTVSLNPGTGISIGSNTSVSADGRTLTVSLSTAAGAPFISHVVVVTTAAGATGTDPVPANTFSVVTDLDP